MIKCSPFHYFYTIPEIILLAVVLFVRFPFWLRNVSVVKRIGLQNGLRIGGSGSFA
jgi:hypothetical protein